MGRTAVLFSPFLASHSGTFEHDAAFTEAKIKE